MSYVLYACFAHVVWILEVIEKLKENKKILGPHEAHEKFSLLCKNYADETRALVQHIFNNYISWSPSYGALNN